MWTLKRFLLVLFVVLCSAHLHSQSLNEQLATKLEEVMIVNAELLNTLNEQNTQLLKQQNESENLQKQLDVLNKQLAQAKSSIVELENSLSAQQKSSKRQRNFYTIAKVAVPVAIVLSFIGGGYLGYKLSKD